MSPKNRQPIDDEPEELPGIPAGHVPMTRPRRPEPKKRKASVWWGVAGFVVAVAVALTVIVVASLPDDPQESGPKAMAGAVAEAISGHDLAKLDSYLCAQHTPEPDEVALLHEFGNTTAIGADDPKPDEIFASATLRSSDKRGTDLVLQLASDNGKWCVLGVFPCQVLVNGRPTDQPLSDLCKDRPLV